MTDDPPDRARLRDAVSRMLRILWRVVRYASVLSWEALALAVRLAADATAAVAALLYGWQQRRNPERADTYARRLSSMPSRRAARWDAWRALPIRRRLEIGAAAIVLAAIAGAAGRASLTQPSVTTIETGDHRSRAPSDPEPGDEISPNVDEMAAAFDARRRTAAPGAWLVSRGPVLIRGRLHDWDDFKVGAPVVVHEAGGWLGRGRRYRMWYRGCRFSAGDYACGIGHAESSDGFRWSKRSGPVFVPNDRIERERLDSIALVRAGDRYYLWYSVGLDWLNGRRNSTLHLAVSGDGLSWEAKGTVLRSVESDTARVIQPAALHDGRLFHLWYVDKRTPDGPRLLLHLTSPDGQRWQIAGSTPYDEWRLEPGRLFVVAQPGGGYSALVARRSRDRGDHPGYFSVLQSSDGSFWRLAEDAPPDETGTIPRRFDVAMPSGAFFGGDLWLWFVVRPENGVEEIRVACRKRSKT